MSKQATTRRTQHLKLLPIAMAVMYASQLAAQTTPQEPRAKDEAQVVEITAQKRSQKIQDVPLSLTAISGAALEDRGIEGPAALTGVVPNLNMAQAPVSGLIAAVGMRGIASGQPSIWADPAVGLYVDGVFVGKNMGALFDVIDIARLEALRGPQGTLFGRNTEAGAINFITRKPTGQFGGSAGFELGSFNRVVGRLSVDTPTVGPLSASFTLRNETQDGVVANPNGAAWGSKDRTAGRIAVRYQPSKAFTLDYAFDSSHIDETPPAGSLLSSRGYGSLYPLTTQIGGNTFAFQNASCLAPNPAGGCLFPSPGMGNALRPFENPNYPTAVSGSTALGKQYQRLDLKGHSVTAEYKLDKDTSLKYIGSVRDMVYGDNADYDGTPLLIFSGIRHTDYTAQSHELQVVGGTGALRYVAGAFLYSEDGTTLQNQAGGLLTFHPNVPGFQASNFTIGTDAKALYGQVDYDIGRLGIGLGGRYTQETKSVRSWRYRTNAAFVQQGANTLDLSGEQTFSQFTPSVNLLYRLTKDTNLFARVAKGFKSGGFPAEAPVTPTGCTTACVSAPNKSFAPETSVAVEAGIKTSFMGGKGQLNANLFRMSVKDYQLSLLPAGSISPTIVNAGKLITQGLEIDAAVAPTDNIRVTVSYGFLDAKFKEYKALSATNQPVDAASNSVVAAAPKHTLSLGVDAKLFNTAGGMGVRGLFNYRYVAERYTYPGQISATVPNATVGNSAAESLMPALGLLDLKLVLGGIKAGPGGGEGEFSVFVKNATNQRKTVAHMDISGFYQVGFWSEPRAYGVSYNYRW
ncbi:MAG: TonB-dependent receptor [Rubrivivax sp.]